MTDLDFDLNNKTTLRALGWGAYDSSEKKSEELRQVNLELHKVWAKIGNTQFLEIHFHDNSITINYIFPTWLSVTVRTDCRECKDYYQFETKVGPNGEDTCKGDSGNCLLGFPWNILIRITLN